MKPSAKSIDVARVRLDLAPQYHARLRVLAARAGKPMSAYVRELIEREIDRKGDKAT